MKYLLNPNTGIVHLVNNFPAPNREGFTHCGMWTGFLDIIRKPTGRKSVRYCQRCKQLSADDFDE
jgi:hypothetical protein